MEIRLSKERLLQAENEEEAVAYIGLKIMFDKMLSRCKNEVLLTTDTVSIYYELSHSFKFTDTNLNKIDVGITALESHNIIKILDSDSKGHYYLDITNLKIRDSKTEEIEYYVTMDTEEINKIFNIKCKQKFSLLRFAIGIYGSINYNTKYGYTSFAKMPEITGIKSKSSCQRFFSLLEESNCLYVCHPNKIKRDKSGQIKSLSNVYGRLVDKQTINDYYVDICDTQAHDFTLSMSSQRKATVTKRYNQYIKGDYKDNVVTLIQECLFYNSLPYNEKHKEKQKTMSVFDAELVKQCKQTLSEYIKKTKEKQVNNSSDYQEDYDNTPDPF